MITNKQADVLAHTSSNGRYVTDETLVLEMAQDGLLHDRGAQRLAGGMHYFTMTALGRYALNEWRAVQPKPPKSKRRCTEAFRKWRDYCDAFNHIPFSTFWKEIWPTYQRRGWL